MTLRNRFLLELAMNYQSCLLCFDARDMKVYHSYAEPVSGASDGLQIRAVSPSRDTTQKHDRRQYPTYL